MKEETQKKEVKLKPEVDFDRIRQDVTDTGRNIWLAGLGAFARAEEGSRNVFDQLVERGRKVETRQFKSIDKTVARTSENLKDFGDRVQGTVQDGVAGVLHRVGLPTRDDLEHLSARLNALSQKVDQVAAKRR